MIRGLERKFPREAFMVATKSMMAGVVAMAALFGARGGLLAQEKGAKKDDEAGAARGRSPRWTERLFRQATQGKEFESFLGGELRFKDPEGKALSVVANPGKVVKLTTDSITLELNDGSGAKDFPVKSDGADGRELSRQLRRIRVGDRALVININGETKWAVPILNEPEKSKDEEKKDKKDKADEKGKGKEKEKGTLSKRKE